jgi:hypothetical protein
MNKPRVGDRTSPGTEAKNKVSAELLVMDNVVLIF